MNFEIHPAFRLALAAEELKDYETGFIDQTAGDQSVQISAGSNIVIKQTIGEVAGGTVVGDVIFRPDVGPDNANFEKLFDLLVEKIKVRPEDPNVDKREIQDVVNLIKMEVARGEGANEIKFERWIRNLSMIAPDIFEMMAVSLSEPVSGVNTLIRKTTMKVKAKAENKG